MERKVPHTLRTDKNVSKLPSSLSDASANEGTRHEIEINISKNTAIFLFFFTLHLFLKCIGLRFQCLKTKETLSAGSIRPPQSLPFNFRDVTLLHSYRFSKVPRHIYVTATLSCNIVCKKLQRNDRHKWEKLGFCIGSKDNIL